MQHGSPRKTPRSYLEIFSWLFPVMVWYVGCFFLHGNLGKYSDDWAMGSVNPVTGALDLYVSPFSQPYFWRPLLQVFLHFMFGLLWNHMWVFHILNVSLHAFNVFLLWKLLRTLCATPTAPMAGALLFLVCPLNYEVIFWSTAITTSLGTTLSLALAIVLSRSASGQYPKDRTPRFRITMAVLSFCIPCFYEQPSALILTFPLLMRACDSLSAAVTERLLSRRALVVTAVCALPIAMYVVLLALTAPRHTRGSAGSFISIGEILSRFGELGGNLKWFYTGFAPQAMSGGMKNATNTLIPVAAGRVPMSIALWNLALAAVGGGWVSWWCRGVPGRERGVSRDSSDAPSTEQGTKPGMKQSTRAWAMLWAVAAVLASWLPLLPVRGQIMEVRHNYFTMIGVGALVSLLLDALLERTRNLRHAWTLRFLTGICIASATIAMAWALLGWQLAMQARSRRDVAQATAIANLAKQSPSGTVFLILEDNCPAANTGQLFFDRMLLSWAAANWSVRPGLQHAAGRDDIFAVHRNFWVPPPITSISTAGYVYEVIPNQSGRPDPISGRFTTWAQTVPLIINADGGITLINQLILKREKGDSIVVALPEVKAIQERVPGTPAITHSWAPLPGAFGSEIK